jgi:hypothetical protein
MQQSARITEKVTAYPFPEDELYRRIRKASDEEEGRGIAAASTTR